MHVKTGSDEDALRMRVNKNVVKWLQYVFSIKTNNIGKNNNKFSIKSTGLTTKFS